MRELLAEPDMQPWEDVRFVFVPELLLEIQDTFKNPSRSELELIEDYASPALLVWDDFGAESLSEYASRTLFVLQNKRQGKANIYTSNFGLSQIDQRSATGYTQRMTSRIAGTCRVVRMTGPDRRLQRRG